MMASCLLLCEISCILHTCM